jgi:hypothetical protein
MRIIDADELLKGKTDHEMISTHLIFNAPTVDVLDKIRAEIEQEISNASSVDYINGLNVALMIINEKYR